MSEPDNAVPLATLARVYAAALDELERAEMFMKEEWPHGIEVQVGWAYRRAMPGYAELSREVSDLVTTNMRELLNTAMELLRVKVRLAEVALQVKMGIIKNDE